MWRSSIFAALIYAMQIIPVTDKTTAQQFLEVAVIINKKDPNWIRPLDKDINEVFDKEKTKHFDLEK